MQAAGGCLGYTWTSEGTGVCARAPRDRSPPRPLRGVSQGPHSDSRAAAAVLGSSSARLPGNCEKRGPSARVPA